ncbi:type VI secretion system tip protein VgrG [Klebsiella pneumoniae]
MSSNPPIRFSHNHHLLSVKGCEAGLDVLAFEGDEALSQPFRYRIEFTSADHAIGKEMMLMKAASLTLQAPVAQGFGINVQQPVRVIQGVVTGFERLSTSRDETHYALTLQPRLALLNRSHQNAIYQDQSVPQIVEKILRERHGLRGQDFLFSLTKTYPRREQVMQYGEDDLRFITRLLGEVGIWFRFTADTRLHIDVAEFCDSQQGYEKGLTLPSVPPSGQQSAGVDAVWEMACRHRVVEQQVSTRDYNYREATADMNAQVDVTRGETTTFGEAYHWGDNYLTAGNVHDRHPAPESGAFYARLRHERYLNGQTRMQATTSCPTLCPGQVLKVTGGEEVAGEFADGVLVTAMHSHARRDADFAVEFAGIPDSPDVGYRPEPGARPVMAGTLPARVTSTRENDTYGHIDKHGRYRVNMLFDRARWETGFESLWVRQSRPYAGDTYGLHLPLLAGTEVAIGFEDGNPDRPYIAGVLHDSAHGDHVTIRNDKRNVLRTPANNKIRLDDERGKEHIKLSTEYGGKSQLNLGHLVDSDRQPRGEGFELRTDSWGAIRAQKGIFISADGQAQAQGQVLDMEPAVSNLAEAREQMMSISGDAQKATANPADLQAQITLLEQQLTDLKKSVLLVSAPEGIALTSGEHGVLITAMHSHARRDADFAVEFAGIPDSPDVGYRPEPGARPVMAGTLPARVTSTRENDTYGHIDKHGRYRVNMLFDRARWETGFESLWVRQSRPYAGDTYGLHLPLLAGTEVAIGFEDGNPDRPYIAGVLHDSAHGDHVTIRNDKRNVLRTPANNKIRLDDERGKEHIKVSTEYGGKSQLNLGHLVDSDRQPRGEGFELRTDSRGAIRAQKGIFISADGQVQAQGQVLDMEPAVSNLAEAREQMMSISGDAQKATANPADLQAQITLLEQQLTDLKKSVLLVSAPEGIALTSGEHLQVSAGHNLIATAGKNADVSVVKNLFIGVGSALSVFVRKLGIRLIANQGPVQMQAQNDLMALLARKEISIVSTEDSIEIIAKKRVTINGGGSYITLNASGIESATQGEYLTKAGHYGRKEKASKQEDFPNLAPETTEPCSKFRFS